MDYKKFNRTNAVIETVGSIAAAVWAVINLFFCGKQSRHTPFVHYGRRINKKQPLFYVDGA